MAIVKAEIVYEGGTYDLTHDGTRYYAELTAPEEQYKSDEKYRYLPIMLRLYDDAGNVTLKTFSDAEFRDGLLLIVRNLDIFPLQPIVATSSGHELRFVDNASRIDIDIGRDNDFSMIFEADEWNSDDYDYGYQLFVPFTEFGGILEKKKTSTKNNTVEWLGYTWRGLLNQKVVEPPAGQEHLIVSGEANTVIAQIIVEKFDSLFKVAEHDSGLQINYKVDRYITILEALNKMLASVGARLNICYKQSGPNEPGAVWLSAVKIQDWSEVLEYSQDCELNFTAEDNRMGINHLICGGKGEGVQREIRHLYVLQDGSIGNKKHYTGLAERTAFYDYSSAEGEELRKNGIKKLTELKNSSKMKIDIDNADIELGDIVGGRDRLTGISVKLPITKKILTIEEGISNIKYEIEEVE